MDVPGFPMDGGGRAASGTAAESNAWSSCRGHRAALFVGGAAIGVGVGRLRIGGRTFTAPRWRQLRAQVRVWRKDADRKSTRLNPVTNAPLVCRLLLEKKNKKNNKRQ